MSNQEAESLEVAHSHFIPKTGLTSVEFPGPVSSFAAAQASIYQHDLNRCFNEGGKWLEMRLRPEQHYGIPIKGSTLPVQRLLLKVTRRRKRSSAGTGGVFTASMEGPVNTTVRFRALADYQYTPSMEGHTVKLVEAMRQLDYDAILSHTFRTPTEVLNNVDTASAGVPRSFVEILPPPLSSVKVLPFPYSFRSSNASQVELVPDEVNGGFRRRLVLRQKYVGAAMQQINHDHLKKDVPCQSDKSISNKQHNLKSALVKKLEKILETRPMWTRQALLNQLSEDERQIFVLNKSYLPAVAYTFVDGPFRSLIVKFNYDPTVDPQARQYQRVSFTNASTTQAARKQAGGELGDDGYQPGDTAWDTNQRRRAELGQRGPLNPLRSHIFDGKELHRARGEYQWCDVTDPLIRRLASDAEFSDTCDSADGWFNSSQHQSLKAILRLKFRQLETDLPAPDSMCDDLIAEFNGSDMTAVPRLPEDESDASTDAGENASSSVATDNTKAQAREKPTTSSRYRSALMPEQQMASRLLKEVKRTQATSNM